VEGGHWSSLISILARTHQACKKSGSARKYRHYERVRLSWSTNAINVRFPPNPAEEVGKGGACFGGAATSGPTTIMGVKQPRFPRITPATVKHHCNEVLAP